jgi:tetratricopeptide (TPR) repeat protein
MLASYHQLAKVLVLRHSGELATIFGLALIALSLTGSTRNAAIDSNVTFHTDPAVLIRQRDEAKNLYTASRYAEARDLYLAVARSAEITGTSHTAAVSWSSAGGLSVVLLQFRDALTYFLRARRIAEATHDLDALSGTLNNLASLYLTLGNEADALQVARDGLALPETSTAPSVRAKLRYGEAMALASLGRFDESLPIFRQAVGALEDLGDLENAARSMGAFGIACLNANHPAEAESALSNALATVRIHHLNNAANILRGLGRVKARQGDVRSATALFQAALDAPPAATPRWLIYADRGDFRLGTRDWQGALEDFRESRRLAAQMRADVVPADQDRVALEGGLNRAAAGLVEAGNQLAGSAMDHRLIEETFGAAEQDRLWSLRALIPAPNDWRTRLPPVYWDVLARYQTAQRDDMARPSAASDSSAASMRRQLEQMEVLAAGGAPDRRRVPASDAPGSELRHVRSVLDPASVLFSFHLGKSGGWLWAADRDHVSVYRIADLSSWKADAAALTLAVRNGDASARGLGQRVYRNLFGDVAKSYLSHPRWLLELDGPLFDVPFPALMTEDGRGGSEYLGARAALELIPSALMLKPREPFQAGEFLGVGDPIYNAADARYGRSRGSPRMALPRLPATATELEACAREWGSKAHLLTGGHATAPEVGTALDSNPAVVHFATHVIAGPGDYSSGLIALSLDRTGSVGLLGPTEIVAHPVKVQLVVLNGCHSAQGAALPGAGLMGLTRAWIGAGAKAVLATRWDIPDDAGQAVMVAFYRALRSSPGQGPAFALQKAQLELARDTRWPPSVWAAYFLLAQE